MIAYDGIDTQAHSKVRYLNTLDVEQPNRLPTPSFALPCALRPCLLLVTLERRF